MNEHGRCKRCGAPLLWLVNVRNHHRVPVDVDPARDGVVTIEPGRTWDGVRFARVHANPEVAAATGLDRPRYRLHTAACKPTSKNRRK